MGAARGARHACLKSSVEVFGIAAADALAKTVMKQRERTGCAEVGSTETFVAGGSAREAVGAVEVKASDTGETGGSSSSASCARRVAAAVIGSIQNITGVA